MKKKILSGIFALALLATTGYGVNRSMKSNADLSGITLANVEALAQTEIGDCAILDIRKYGQMVVFIIVLGVQMVV